MANWFTQYGGKGEYAGGAGISAYRRALDAGYTPQQIKDAAPGSGLHIGSGLRNTLAAISSPAARPDLSGQLAAAEARAQSYQSQLQGYQSQLSDWSSRLSNMQGQYQTAMTGKSEAESLASQMEGKWKQSEADYEDAKSLADRYKQEAVDTQLQGLRTGSTVQGRQAAPHLGLARGSGDVSRVSSDRDKALDIEKKIDAEDSVLNRSGPVVQTMRSSSNNSSPETARRTLAGSNSGGAYYAGRFG